MDLLIIGGTAFVGRAIADYALDKGHNVTVFHRGKTNPDILPEAEHLFGDRTEDLSALSGKKWDAVIDTCGYVPRIVKMSADFLKDSVNHYTFISTISVYDQRDELEYIDENSPLATLEDESTEEITGETYGALKVLCENVVAETYPDSYLIVRPGLIVGPNDYTHRFAYWIWRTAEGGEMIAPGDPDQKMQVIDARDLAKFTVDLTEQKVTGEFNATGPGYAIKDILEVSQEVTNSDTNFTWIDEAFLIENEVNPWLSLPLWVPDNMKTIHNTRIDKAVTAGLTHRSLEEIIQDSYAWLQAEDMRDIEDRRTPVGIPQGSLPREKETEVLAAWHEHK